MMMKNYEIDQLNIIIEASRNFILMCDNAIKLILIPPDQFNPRKDIK